MKKLKILNKKFEIFNKYYFKDLSHLDLQWELREDGAVIKQDTTNMPSASPRSRIGFNIDIGEFNKVAGREYLIKLSTRTRHSEGLVPAGHEVAWEQFLLPNEDPLPSNYSLASFPSLTVTDNMGDVRIAGRDFELHVDRITGELQRYLFNGIDLLASSPTPNTTA